MDDDADAPESGYRVANIDQHSGRFRCPYCMLIMNNPIQMYECGHRACRACFDYRADKSIDGNVTCPAEDCGEVMDKQQIMLDRAFKRELDHLSVGCAYQSSNGPCPWTGLLREYQTHLDSNHNVHMCVDCQENFSSNVALREHRTRRCPAVFQACPIFPVCGEELVRKDQLLSHYLSEPHQGGLVQILTGRASLPPPPLEPEDLQSMAILQEFEAKTNERVAYVASQVQKVTDETARIDQSFTQFDGHRQRLTEEHHQCRLKLNEQLPTMSQIQQTQTKLQKEVEELYTLFEKNQHVSTDGTLTWRIENMSEKFADAQSERQTSVYSPVFYSSPRGYKMQVRLFPFGDGSARRTHMSLFFSLLKGEDDAILTWPFKYKISFCLLDQTEAGAHVIDSFYPDVKSSSFHRPTNTANVANGLPKFVNLTIVQQDNNPYIREETMYLKIIIELNDRPKMYLPLLLKVNPALPTHIQEQVVQQELAKQQ